MKRKILIYYILSMIFLLFLTGCNVISGLVNTVSESKGSENSVDVPPEVAQQKSQRSVTLYFGFRTEDLLVPDIRDLAVQPNERDELAIMRMLIQGPLVEKQDMIPLINDRVKVISVTDQKDILFITLSSEFLTEPPPGITLSPEEAGYEDAVRKARELSVLSICNTMVENSQINSVQLLIETADGGTGQRITRGEAGFTENPAALLAPLKRDGTVVLTPENTVTCMFEAIGQMDAQRIYPLIASTGLSDELRPSQDEIKEIIENASPVVEHFEILPNTSMSADGQTALVTVDYTLRLASPEESPMDRQSYLIKLVNENGICKFGYNTFLAIVTPGS